MLCFRCRALPSTLNSYAAARPGLGLLARPTPSKQQQTPPPSTTTRIATQQTRPFSSILTRLPQSQSPFHSTTTITRPSVFLSLPQSINQQTRLFSASASLAGKRRTYNPSRRVQKRRHGFLARLRTRGGRKILANRRAKGKKHLSW